MKKIKSMFVRNFGGYGQPTEITPVFTDAECEEALKNGCATVKYDGSPVFIDGDGKLFARFDAKKGNAAPAGAIPCCDPDPVTGHHPHWVPCFDENGNAKSQYKWHIRAFENASKLADSLGVPLELNKSYEALGPHFQGNPYGLPEDILYKHGADVYKIPDDKHNFDGICEIIKNSPDMEGLVFWLNGEPVCKIKRIDMGLEWNGKATKR